MAPPASRSINLRAVPLEPTTAHDGHGTILFRRLLSRTDVAGGCNFVDFTSMPPGTSIGVHTHAADNEEYYLVLSGAGRMTSEQEEFDVGAGDLIRNPPGGTHGLVNTGAGHLELFVFEVAVDDRVPRVPPA